MNSLTITISWEWALGIIGLLIVLAWKGSARFAALETSMDWVKKTLADLKTNAEAASLSQSPFLRQSPVNLTELGKQWLEESGLKAYIEAHPQTFLDACAQKKYSNPYEVQKDAFDLLENIPIEHAVEEQLKRFAFEKGVSMDILRRIGGIYLRNLCLERFQMNAQDIDQHDPEKGK
jgi:hypothetical protein